jgi:hypothetical protein
MNGGKNTPDFNIKKHETLTMAHKAIAIPGRNTSQRFIA